MLRRCVVNIVVVDEKLRSELKDAQGRVTVCDEAGETLGYFVPATEELRQLYELAKAAFSDEELQRALTETGGRPLTEILADLERQWPSQ